MTTIELKQAHAERVLALLAQVQAEIALDPDNLWFGGLPPAFEELVRICAHRADNIRTVFQLAAAQAATPPVIESNMSEGARLAAAMAQASE